MRLETKQKRMLVDMIEKDIAACDHYIIKNKERKEYLVKALNAALKMQQMSRRKFR